MKEHLRLDDDAADAVDARLTGLIMAAHMQTERMILQWFPAEIPLARPPIRSVESVVYDDGGGIEETLEPNEYRLAGDTLVSTYRDRRWPRTELRLNSVRIADKIGYAEVPAPIENAMLVMIESLSDRHAEKCDDTLARLLDALLWPYRQIAV